MPLSSIRLFAFRVTDAIDNLNGADNRTDSQVVGAKFKFGGFFAFDSKRRLNQHPAPKMCTPWPVLHIFAQMHNRVCPGLSN
jgi:hypothetical protein